jgi:invasion protein IalB
MSLSARLAATAIASLLLTGSAFAQAAATPPAADKAAPAATEKKARSAASLECSKEADEKGLKGKERKKFRSACKKEHAAGGAADTKAK